MIAAAGKVDRKKRENYEGKRQALARNLGRVAKIMVGIEKCLFLLGIFLLHSHFCNRTEIWWR
ncbi:MAG: hypothetical protein HY231_07265 [Acidobacteria bacterium]|nr:hypothetical protein [Acidobacteriota bacterium]